MDQNGKTLLPEDMSRKRSILAFAIAIICVFGVVCVYLNQLSNTVNTNLMLQVHEISDHDVESIVATIDDSYARLDSVADRIEAFGVTTIDGLQRQLAIEGDSSKLFDALYLLDENGMLYGNTDKVLAADMHAYDELMANGCEHFVRLYDPDGGDLDTTRESLIFGIRLNDVRIADHNFVALIGRGDVSSIRDQLLIESFNGQGVSSVVNAEGYYVVRASSATDLAEHENFYDMLEAGYLEGGTTIEQVRENLSKGESFVVDCVTDSGQQLILSFAPIEGTNLSFIMAVPRQVFDDRFSSFISMTAGMLIGVVIVIVIMLALLIGFIKRTVSANARAATRTEFLQTMSHEIRTPLNGIIGLNYLMESHLDDREAMEGYVKKLGKAAKYLLGLINDILDVSKLQAGKVELEERSFDLKAVIDTVCEMQREPMAAGDIRFILRADHLPYPYLIGDEIRISQVLMNILSNAVKFTPKQGTITLQASQRPAVTPGHAVTSISITDTGCGMTPEFQEKIFDVFTQERNAISDSQKGTGLGMSISYLLVEQMGGHLSVESAVGKGSTVTMVLTTPVDSERRKQMAAAEMQKKLEAATEVADTSDDTPLKVLVAEDNALNADIISAILEEEGCEIVLAENGREAVNAFLASDIGEFDVILMDAQMPVLDGYEATEEIRRCGRSDATTVKIYACTASTLAEDRARAEEAGMDDFLTKPLNMPIVLEKLGLADRGSKNTR